MMNIFAFNIVLDTGQCYGNREKCAEAHSNHT